MLPRVRPTARTKAASLKNIDMKTLAFRDITFDVRTINHTVYITSKQLAQALGYARHDAVTKIYNRNADEFSSDMTRSPKLGKQEMSLPQFGVVGQDAARLFSLRGAHLIAMFARTPVAKEFRRWVLDVLDKEVKPSKQFSLGFGDLEQYKTLNERAEKYIKDCILHAKNGSNGVWPKMDIPDDVLAGLVAQHLPHVGFYLDIDYDGTVSIRVRQSPYKGLIKAIADPGNIGLQDSVIEEVCQACVTALAHRAKKREEALKMKRGQA